MIMIRLVFVDRTIASDQLHQHFDCFQNEGGKLPSFSVSIDRLSKANISGFTSVAKLGDYVFYEQQDNSFWISFRGSYLRMDKDLTCADVYLSGNVRFDGQFEISYLIMQAYMYRLVDTGNFMIHSAAVVYHNSGILLCGMSGAGKSTHANLWKMYLHADMLNYDKPCIINENGSFFAHGSPWSGKERLTINQYVPLKAIVFVKQSKDNRIVRLSPAQGFSNIYLHNYVYPFTKEIEDKYTAAVQKVAAHIPVYELYCDISENAVEVLYNELFHDSSYMAERRKYREI